MERLIPMDVMECPNLKEDVRECPRFDWAETFGFGYGLAAGEEYASCCCGFSEFVDTPYYEKVVGYGLQCLIKEESL